MNIVNYETFDFKHVSLYKNKNIGFFPIKYKKKNLILKSPTLILPNGVSTYRNTLKKYLLFNFPSIFSKKHITFYKLLLNIDKFFNKNISNLLKHINLYRKNNNKDKIYKKNVIVKKCINNDLQEPVFKTNLSENIKFYNSQDEEIDIHDIKKFSHCRILFYISGIWFHDNKFGLLIYCLQLKTIEFKNKCFLEDYDNQVIINNENKDKVTIKKICCPNCNETLKLIINNLINITKSNITIIPDEYNKFIKMRKVGVPSIAIKHKLMLENLDYKTFLDYLKSNNTNNTNNTNNNNNINKKVNLDHGKKKINFADLLKQKKRLKKTKIIKHKKPFIHKLTKVNKNVLVPSLQDILKTLKSLRSTKVKNF